MIALPAGTAGRDHLGARTFVMIEDRTSRTVKSNGLVQSGVQVTPAVCHEKPVIEVTKTRGLRDLAPHVSDPRVAQEVAQDLRERAALWNADHAVFDLAVKDEGNWLTLQKESCSTKRHQELQ